MRFSSGEYDGRNNPAHGTQLSRQRLHGVALLAGLVQNKKITKYHGSWAVFFVENAFLNTFLGVFFRDREALVQKVYVES